MSKTSGSSAPSHTNARLEHLHSIAYLYWVKDYILFQHKRHPSELNQQHIGIWLTHLAVKRKVAHGKFAVWLRLTFDEMRWVARRRYTSSSIGLSVILGKAEPESTEHRPPLSIGVYC